MQAFILRGLPGSGKSYWAKEVKDAKIVSADAYFMVDGKYQFDLSKLREAHNWCLLKFMEHITNHRPETIIVDNTNIRIFEFSPYYRIAEVFGFEVKIVQIQRDLEKCILNNIHSVPKETIELMAKSFEPVPHFWNYQLIINPN